MNLALDLDGTLLTCEPRQTAVLRAAFRQPVANGILDRIWRLKRDGASTREALTSCGVALSDVPEIALCWRNWIEEPFWLALDQLLPDATQACQDLFAAGLRPVLITARSREEWLLPQLHHLDLIRYFSKICCVSPPTAAESKACILKALAIDTYVGDSEVDAKAAELAGTPFLCVSSGQRSAEFLRRSGIKPVFPTISEVVRSLRI